MAERSLVERHDFQTLVDHLEGVAIWVVSEPGTFDYISDGFEEIFGLPPEALREDPSRLLECIHPDDRDRVRSAMREERQDISEASYENRVVRPDGTVRWVHTRQFPVLDRDGNFAVLVGVNTDITEQKRREEELEVLNRVVRHDIRNDMNVVMGWAQSLEGHVDPTGREYQERILRASEHVVELTEVAREYVETVTSEAEMEVVPTPIRPILTTAIDLGRESYPEATFVVQGEVPSVAVVGNDILQSVFRNLLNNAVQHNRSESPRVEVACEVGPDDLVVSVADDGPGVPDEQKQSIFGKGDRGLDSPGTGIGLFLVRSIVEQCGGEVWVADNQPDGAVFNVRLPLAE